MSVGPWKFCIVGECCCGLTLLWPDLTMFIFRQTSAGKAEVDAEVTKNLMNVWKTRETNPEPENKERKSQIKIREEVSQG